VTMGGIRVGVRDEQRHVDVGEHVKVNGGRRRCSQHVKWLGIR
jgi:hypothetical protein